MMHQIQTAAVVILGMTALLPTTLAAPVTEDKRQTETTSTTPWYPAVYERFNFDPALTRVAEGAEARVLRGYNPFREAAAINIFNLPAYPTAGATCEIDFKFTAAVASLSGTGQAQVFFCEPNTDATGKLTGCSRQSHIGTIQARVGAPTTFIPGQGQANGKVDCAKFFGKRYGIDMAAVGNTDSLTWQPSINDGVYLKVTRST